MNLELLRKSEITKSEINNLVDSVVSQVRDNGTMNPLEVITKSKILEEIAKGLKAKLTADAIDEFEKFGKMESVKFSGIEITMKSRKAGLNYEEDDEYLRLNEALKQRKKDLDDAFTNFQKGRETVIDGEQIPVVTSKGKGATFFNFKIQ